MSVASFLVPRLQVLARALREAMTRAEQPRDEEAVHDLRVALRRLRSLLKPARKVFGEFHTDHVRTALKAVADATGELRDEEVLEETIAALTLPASARRARDAWLRRRHGRERELRQGLRALLRSGQPAQAAAQLDALLLLPVDPRHDRPVGPFAERVVHRAARRVAQGQDVSAADVEKLHTLRILYKRLRYAAEGFADVLAPELAAQARVAEKFQKRLGEVHDLDVALARVSEDDSLPASAQQALRDALAVAREERVARYLDERKKAQQPREGPPSGAATELLKKPGEPKKPSAPKRASEPKKPAAAKKSAPKPRGSGARPAVAKGPPGPPLRRGGMRKGR